VSARVEGCVFCDPAAQPASLWENEHVRVVPDKFPLFPGHTLVISQAHLPCFGAATPEVLDAADAAVARARQFIDAAYGVDPLLWENGVAGQSVFHAHLHLIPAPLKELPIDPATAGDWFPITGWAPVIEHYQHHDNYHLAELGGQRRLLVGHGEAAWEMRRILGQAAGVRFENGQWLRSTTAADVAAVRPRYEAWATAKRESVDARTDA
jgi:histidine triad (HIT) family protein